MDIYEIVLWPKTSLSQIFHINATFYCLCLLEDVHKRRHKLKDVVGRFNFYEIFWNFAWRFSLIKISRHFWWIFPVFMNNVRLDVKAFHKKILTTKSFIFIDCLPFENSPRALTNYSKKFPSRSKSKKSHWSIHHYR